MGYLKLLLWFQTSIIVCKVIREIKFAVSKDIHVNESHVPRVVQSVGAGDGRELERTETHINNWRFDKLPS